MLKSLCFLWVLTVLFLPMIRALEPSTTSPVKWPHISLLRSENLSSAVAQQRDQRVVSVVPAVQPASRGVYFLTEEICWGNPQVLPLVAAL